MIKDGTLAYIDRKLDEVQCEAIRDFLTNSSNMENKVKGLIFNNCVASDKALDLILEGCVNQIKTKRRGGK